MQSLSIVSLAASLALTVAAAGCSKPPPPPEPVRAVRVLTVGVDSIQSNAEFAGEVRARSESRLGFRVAGKITLRPVELGQRVKAGQLLAQLDAQDYRLAADAAKAQVSAAATNRNLAAADLKRFKELKDQNFISGAEVERRETTYEAAQAQLEQAQSQLSAQRNQSAYTHLLADVSGVVTAVEAEPGQVVAAGTPVVRIAQDGPRDVVFAVPEDRVGLIRAGSGVDVRQWTSPTVFKGTVREVAASADPVTRTFQVKVALGAKDALALGTTVTVVPEVFARSGLPVIKLPTSAIKRDGANTAVWVVDTPSMTLKSVAVQVATADGNDVVLSGGLMPGMVVVVAGVHVLTNGQKITLYKEPPSQAPKPVGPAASVSIAPASPATAPPAPATAALPAASAAK